MAEAVKPTGTAEPRFASGDPVVHPHQGAGTIAGIVTLSYTGEPRRYYNIELVGGDVHIMMPVEQAEEIGLRRADFGMRDIEETLECEPEELPDNYRSRHARLRAMIGSGEPVDLARAVRDLAWRGRQPGTDLTKIDRDLLREAQHMLATEVAARTHTSVEKAMRQLDKKTREAITAHLEGRAA